MCVVSMVYDHFQPLFPNSWPLDPSAYRPTVNPGPWVTIKTNDDLSRLIGDFKLATESAKAVDKLTGRPDCEDAEKAKLVERVAELEKQLVQAKIESEIREDTVRRVCQWIEAEPTADVAGGLLYKASVLAGLKMGSWRKQ